MLRLYRASVIALITAISATPVLSQAANFSTLTITPGFPRASGIVGGNTGGSFSLPSIANSDRNKQPCIGYASQTPDHILILEKDFPKLTLQVRTRMKDTTLMIRGPNNLILCGDDTGPSKDASIEAINLKKGRYEVWVGAIEAGKRWNYTLTVRE
ncbi:MAG: hypothetical protein U7123_17195 [Potamolinea sp.]